MVPQILETQMATQFVCFGRDAFARSALVESVRTPRSNLAVGCRQIRVAEDVTVARLPTLRVIDGGQAGVFFRIEIEMQ